MCESHQLSGWEEGSLWLFSTSSNDEGIHLGQRRQGFPFLMKKGGGFDLLVRISHLLDHSAVLAFESHLVPLHLT